jgi:endogenous inhibitor of DNA gyrase (YacG/DUF329 family)
MQSTGAIMLLECPICGAGVDGAASPHRPFCSERCRWVDLGRWLDGAYVVPGEPVDVESIVGVHGAEG